jgi:hypothetical protein
MFPRNKRRMVPLDTALILRAMVVASELGSSWVGDQGQQNKFSELLEKYGLKGGGNQRDDNSGGSRTYEAQMRLLGLLYKDSSTNTLKLTQAGEDLVNLQEPTKTMEYQILKCQFPSTYSLGRNVGIDRAIKVRPFLFLLKLAADPDLNGLTDKDIMIPVIFGRQDTDLQKCKDLILELRISDFPSVIPDTDEIRTTKTKNNGYNTRLKDIKDIANTFKNVLQGCGLVDLRYVGDETRIFPRRGIMDRVAEVESMPYVDFLGLSDEQATLRYGTRYGAIKDTRRTFMPSKNPELSTKGALVYQEFLDKVGLPASQGQIELFVSEASREYGLTRDVIIDALQPIFSDANYYIGARLIELSKGGTKAAEDFEKSVAKIFEVEFGYGDVQWTGRRRRSGLGGFMDVFVVEVERNLCGIIDTKSTNSYDLPHQDVTKAITTYIDTASELYGSRNLDLAFVGYVSHLIADGAVTRAKEIYNAKSIPVSLVSAYGLNSLRQEFGGINRPDLVTTRLTSDSVNLFA